LSSDDLPEGEFWGEKNQKNKVKGEESYKETARTEEVLVYIVAKGPWSMASELKEGERKLSTGF